MVFRRLLMNKYDYVVRLICGSMVMGVYYHFNNGLLEVRNLSKGGRVISTINFITARVRLTRVNVLRRHPRNMRTLLRSLLPIYRGR